MTGPARTALAGAAVILMMTCSSLAVPAPVPPATVVQAPDWSVGSEWHYSDGYGLKVSSVTPQGTVFDRLDAPGQWFSRLGFIRKDATSATAKRSSIFRTVPDNAGLSLSAAAPLTFQREYMSNGKLMVHASSWTLEGRETITVPAGTFDCWLIVWRTRSLRSDWTGFERWWYSPQAQSYVRMEYKYGAEPEGSRVLMGYHLGSGSAMPEARPVVETKPNALPLPLKPTPAPLPLKPAPAPLPIKLAASDARAVGAWHVQLGSARDAAGIKKSLQKILRTNAQLEALPYGVSAHNVDGQTFYRAWLGAYDSAGDAQALCQSLKVGKTGCMVFKNATVEAKADQ